VTAERVKGACAAPICKEHGVWLAHDQDSEVFCFRRQIDLPVSARASREAECASAFGDSTGVQQGLGRVIDPVGKFGPMLLAFLRLLLFICTCTFAYVFLLRLPWRRDCLRIPHQTDPTPLSTSRSGAMSLVDDDMLRHLVEMGYDYDVAMAALRRTHNTRLALPSVAFFHTCRRMDEFALVSKTPVVS
jgi:hypothetical protein